MSATIKVRESDIKPAFRQFREGDSDECSHGDPVAYVQSENAARRQLTESQLAYAITHPNILAFEQRKARERQEAAGETYGRGKLGADRHQAIEGAGRVREQLAEKAGVGARTVSRAIKVRESGIPAVNEAVAKGEVTLNMAERMVHRVLTRAARARAARLQADMGRG